jgi:hypothetical protein
MVVDVVPKLSPQERKELESEGSIFEIFGVLGPIAFLWVLFCYGAIAYQLLILQIHGVPIYLVVGIASLIQISGLALFVLRDLRNWRSAAIFQIVVAVVAGTGILFVEAGLTAKIATIGGSVVAAGNGIQRLWNIMQGPVS